MASLETESTCQRFVGLGSLFQASLLVLVASILMLVATLLVIVWQIVSATRSTIRLASSHQEPRLKLPAGCHFHAFVPSRAHEPKPRRRRHPTFCSIACAGAQVSHTWGTGQDQTHALVRQLQLLCPSMRLWLDVEQLDDVGKLEQSVRESATFCIFLSKWYFASKNCALTPCASTLLARSPRQQAPFVAGRPTRALHCNSRQTHHHRSRGG